ncbi:high-affinity nickel-transport protein [Nakamurella sp. UYEF19]|uniref:HoxN/HupN/NixA family nickel/cobalt transporter n=1 Tax=Nakamurella sp. UYEF19 TaxID=1756392 RepID=UPI0033999875
MSVPVSAATAAPTEKAPSIRPLQVIRSAGRALLVVLGLHVLALGLLFAFVIPGHYQVNGKVFGIGLAITAYILGVRHAFDADHIAAIDNTTRKLVGENRKATTVGLFFSLGHSTIVFVMALLLAVGAKVASTLVSDDSAAHQTLGVIGTLVSGVFLLLIGVINLIALQGIIRVWREARRTGMDEAALEKALDGRGFFARLLRPLMRRITRPGQMYPVGVLFGLGFDTATEISLLVLAGAGAATGLPWYAVLVLPLLFAAGMSLFDTLDGAFMHAAYHWAFIRPVRKIYYNLTTTGLSVAVALLIGGIEIIGLLHDKLSWSDPVTTWIANLSLDSVGYLIVGLFVAVFLGSTLYWRMGRVEEKWTAKLLTGQPNPAVAD